MKRQMNNHTLFNSMLLEKIRSVAQTSAALLLCAGISMASNADVTDYRNTVQSEASLLSYYTLDGNGLDSAGSATHDGAAVGAVSYSAGVGGAAGGALTLDGSNFLNLGNSTDFHFADGTGTVSAFLRPTWGGGGANPSWFATRTDSPHASRYSLHVRKDYTKLDSYSSGSGVAGAPTTITANQWMHVAAVYDANSTQFYLNGQPITTAQNGGLGGINANTITQIGRASPTNTGESWIGDIDEVSVFSDALTASAILNQYNAFQDIAPPPPPPPSNDATITLLGSDKDTNANWRTNTVIKPLDADGDNIYGTDGYVFFGYHNSGFANPYNPTFTESSLPTYIAAVSDPNRHWGGGGASNFGLVDDPLNPGQQHNAAHGHNGGALDITINRATDEAFQLTIMIGNDSSYPVVFEEDITVANGLISAMVRHMGSQSDRDASYYVFDIGAGTSDITISLGNVSIDNPGLFGVAFDHAVSIPEPASLTFMVLSLAGLMMRRQKNA